MKFQIQNIAGGSRHECRTLNGAARFIAQNPVYGGYKIVGDKVSPDSDYDAALAVVRYASAARAKIRRDDWSAVVDQCIRWFDGESADEAW